MNIPEALGILKPKDESAPELKTAYRKAVKIYHPDINPNSLEMMKLVNAAYACLKSALGKWHVSDTPTGPSLTDEMQSIFDKIKRFEGVTGEVCGTWLWVSGETYKYRSEIKAAGLRWAKKKAMWYWHAKEDGYKKKSKRTLDMNEIRQLFGSQTLENTPLGALA